MQQYGPRAGLTGQGVARWAGLSQMGRGQHESRWGLKSNSNRGVQSVLPLWDL